jgi:dipeptidyl-peptidase-3
MRCDEVVNPIDDRGAITGPFYAEGATWDTTFGKIASPYEECRAECAGLYLSLEQRVLSIFGHGAQADAVHDVTYINWLLMARAGLSGLEFYTPATKAWRQAHMRARYVILRVLLEAGQGLVRVERTTGANGAPDLVVHLERGLVGSAGRQAIIA